VPVDEGDTEETLAERMHRAEHELYVDVLARLARGRLRLPAARG
jgi:folate-dependent phosphoribosylglycinamide formyltransferase PurN